VYLYLQRYNLQFYFARMEIAKTIDRQVSARVRVRLIGGRGKEAWETTFQLPAHAFLVRPHLQDDVQEQAVEDADTFHQIAWLLLYIHHVPDPLQERLDCGGKSYMHPDPAHASTTPSVPGRSLTELPRRLRHSTQGSGASSNLKCRARAGPVFSGGFSSRDQRYCSYSS
jgi:hypothetical protein